MSEILADLHAHTISSGHAFSTLDEMIVAAKRAGLQLLAITDHGPSMEGAPHAGYFTMAGRLPDVLHDVRLLVGAEVNIVSVAGAMDLSDDQLRIQDIVVAGLHERTPYPGTTFEENTRSLLCAMESGLVHVVSHPYRASLPVDVKKVAEVAAACGVLLEVNVSLLSHALRTRGLDQSEAVIAETKRMIDTLGHEGGCCTVSSDSHHTSELLSFPASSAEVIAALDIPLQLVANRDVDSLRELGWSV
jgi:putative hydrolase